MSQPPPDPTTEAALSVTFGEVSVFLRQLIHDVRNSFNALDLQLAATIELAEEPSPELLEDVRSARQMITDETKRLLKLSEQVRSFKLEKISYPVGELIEDLRDRLGRVLVAEAAQLEWTVEAGSGSVSVDVEKFFVAATELVRNAFHFREGKEPVCIHTLVEPGNLAVEITEACRAIQGDPAEWGLHPFRSTRRGAYGLGLFAVRRTIALLEGSLAFTFAAERGVVITRVTLPLEGPA